MTTTSGHEVVRGSRTGGETPTGKLAVPIDYGEAEVIRVANAELDRAGPADILSWAVDRYGEA